MSAGPRSKRLVFALVLAALATSVVGDAALTREPAPAGCVTPSRHMTLYAEELPPASDGHPRLGYGLAPGEATIPGPLIEMQEGECLAITLVNDVRAETLADLRDQYGDAHDAHKLPLAVSLHVHGVKYLPSSDGTVHSGSYVPPGQARTFVWYAAPRLASPGQIGGHGTAGYWWYHDHVVGSEHGTGGGAAGLVGGLVVRRAGDPKPDRSYTVAMGPEATINLRKSPDTDCIGEPTISQSSNTCFVAREGERVEFLVVGFGSDFHTFHLHGHTWADTRTGVPDPSLDVRLLDTKTVGPAETFGFQIIAGAEVGQGDWMMHCHVQAHSDDGMTTYLHVL